MEQLGRRVQCSVAELRAALQRARALEVDDKWATVEAQYEQDVTECVLSLSSSASGRSTRCRLSCPLWQGQGPGTTHQSAPTHRCHMCDTVIVVKTAAPGRAHTHTHIRVRGHSTTRVSVSAHVERVSRVPARPC
eukprot:1379805-Prymnesium_polylepis.1